MKRHILFLYALCIIISPCTLNGISSDPITTMTQRVIAISNALHKLHTHDYASADDAEWLAQAVERQAYQLRRQSEAFTVLAQEAEKLTHGAFTSMKSKEKHLAWMWGILREACRVLYLDARLADILYNKEAITKACSSDEHAQPKEIRHTIMRACDKLEKVINEHDTLTRRNATPRGTSLLSGIAALKDNVETVEDEQLKEMCHRAYQLHEATIAHITPSQANTVHPSISTLIRDNLQRAYQAMCPSTWRDFFTQHTRLPQTYETSDATTETLTNLAHYLYIREHLNLDTPIAYVDRWANLIRKWNQHSPRHAVATNPLRDLYNVTHLNNILRTLETNRTTTANGPWLTSGILTCTTTAAAGWPFTGIVGAAAISTYACSLPANTMLRHALRWAHTAYPACRWLCMTPEYTYGHTTHAHTREHEPLQAMHRREEQVPDKPTVQKMRTEKRKVTKAALPMFKNYLIRNNRKALAISLQPENVYMLYEKYQAHQPREHRLSMRGITPVAASAHSTDHNDKAKETSRD